MGDHSRLQQVIWNILSNAVKFTPRGGKIDVRVTQNDSHVEIIVADTGVGFPPSFRPHIFERFRQAESGTTRLHGGLGLGLAIVERLQEIAQAKGTTAVPVTKTLRLDLPAPIKR